jgi:hypothetical protein
VRARFSEAGSHLLDQSRVAGDRRLEEGDVLFVGLVRCEQSGSVPGLDGGDAHAETGREFRDGEHAAGAEAFEVAG